MLTLGAKSLLGNSTARLPRLILFSCLLLLIAVYPTTSQADTITETRVFSLDQFNETIPGYLGGEYDYGFVAISIGTFNRTPSGGTATDYEFKFIVDALTTDQTSVVIEGTTFSFTPLFTAGTNFGVQQFGFNDPSNTSTAYFGSSDFLLPTSWNVHFDQNISTWGVFDNDLAGTGSTRQDPLEFFLNDPNKALVIDDFICLTRVSDPTSCPSVKDFEAHIAGFTDINGKTSGFASGGPEKVGTTEVPIPEPTTALLLGSGLLGLLGISRRRFFSKP